MTLGQIDTVVRFHDAARMRELEKCILSLISQTYRPLNVILTLQRFEIDEIAAVEKMVSRLIDFTDDVTCSILNYEQPIPIDARSALLNLGIENATGAYLAFLDYDDVLYPEAYSLLTKQLQKTGATIVFASVRVMRLSVFDEFLYAESEINPPFKGAKLIDLFRANFCPLHSYLLDRRKISTNTLRFNASLTIEEDYDLLLRVCAANRSDFTLIGTHVGDYYYKTDGSNTVPTEGGLSGEALDQYMDVRAEIEKTRKTTNVSATVQRALGLPALDSPVTVRDVVKRFSSGWLSRLTDAIAPSLPFKNEKQS